MSPEYDINTLGVLAGQVLGFGSPPFQGGRWDSVAQHGIQRGWLQRGHDEMECNKTCCKQAFQAHAVE